MCAEAASAIDLVIEDGLHAADELQAYIDAPQCKGNVWAIHGGEVLATLANMPVLR